MPFVLDASAAASWAFRDEDHVAADVALARLRADTALVPALWWFELRNILIVNERRQRLTAAQGTLFLRDLARLPIVEDHPPREQEVLRLARLHRLTVYDATYLELALRHGVALSTLDKLLVEAARAEGVELLGIG
jgi:predicted nucleic acid-binding protein